MASVLLKAPFKGNPAGSVIQVDQELAEWLASRQYGSILQDIPLQADSFEPAAGDAFEAPAAAAPPAPRPARRSVKK